MKQVDMNGRVSVEVSGPMLRQMFHPCELSYVTGTCRGRCCESVNGIMVTIHPTEEDRISALGAEIKARFVVPASNGRCPFKTDDGLCSIHDQKPFGCRASPFTLSASGVLVVRNRYRLLRCYKCEGSVPAYEAHAQSLAAILGAEEARRVSALAAAGADRIAATMGPLEYAMLVDNDAAKKSRKSLPMVQA